MPGYVGPVSEDVIELTTTPAALTARLDALLAARGELVRQRSLAALKTMGLCLLGVGGLAGAAVGLFLFSNGGAGSFLQELAYVVAWLCAVCALVPAYLFFASIPAVFGYDPFGGYVKRVTRFLRHLQPDLHPRVPVRLRLDLRPIADVPPYRTGTSPHSGKSKTWHRVERLVLALALADGTVVAYQAGEKVKLKGGARVRGEGHIRGRVDHHGGAAYPPARRPSLGWGWQALAQHHGILFWRRSWWFRQDLPDVRLLLAHLRGPA